MGRDGWDNDSMNGKEWSCEVSMYLHSRFYSLGRLPKTEESVK